MLLKLNEDDIRKLRQDFYNQMQEVVLDKIFEKCVPMLMNMKEHSYVQEEEPSDEKMWDQKSWSRLCRITATEIHDDADNWLYSILIAALAQCAGSVPDDWRIAKFVGRSKYITGEVAPLSDKATEYVGDILEALGGFVTWKAEQSRRFCKYHDISELKAKEFMFKLDAFVQSGSILISTCDFSEWHATVNFLLHGTPEWQKNKTSLVNVTRC